MVSTLTSVSNIISLRNFPSSLVVTGDEVIVGGFSNPNDGGGGMFYYDASSSTSDDGGIVIEPTDGIGRWLRVRQNNDIQVLWFGTNTTPGTTDMTSALDAAIAAVSSPGGRVILPPGKSLITSKISIAKKMTLCGVGEDISHVIDSFAGSTLLKSASLNDTLLDITGSGVTINGVLVDGLSGNGGAGIHIHGNSVRMSNVCVSRMGGVGIRVGDETSANSNCFYLERVAALNNTSHGLYLRSNPGDDNVNANAGTIIGFTAMNNGGDGIRVDRAFLNVIIGATTESNGGYGIKLTSLSRFNKLYGGDTDEGNTSGSIHVEGVSNVIMGEGSTNFTDAGTETLIINGNHTKLYDLNVYEHPAAAGLVSQIGRQIFMSGDPAVTNNVDVTLFHCSLPINVSSLMGTLYLNYQHGVGGSGIYRCSRAYTIIAVTDDDGLAHSQATEIPEYSTAANLTSNVMTLSWTSGVFTVSNKNNQTSGPGMILSWSFVGHGYNASGYTLG